MMTWFKRKLAQWVREDWSNDTISQVVSNKTRGNLSHIINDKQLDSHATLQFTVYNAIGGKVVEFRRHDSKNDRVDFSMYVIGKDDDFGEKISKIATLEALK